MRQGEEMKKNRIVVNGFAFTDRETAQKAVKEAESIKYIKEKLDMENPRMVLEMYRKLTKEQVFRTPVGLVFLKQLQDCLARKPEFKMENLEPIRAAELKQRRAEERLKGRRGMLQFSVAVNIFLLIVAIGMAVITLMDNQPNIINYENKIVDKYAEWEQGLKEREETIKQREQELGL